VGKTDRGNPRVAQDVDQVVRQVGDFRKPVGEGVVGQHQPVLVDGLLEQRLSEPLQEGALLLGVALLRIDGLARVRDGDVLEHPDLAASPRVGCR
jgi:hypothetical protein